MPELDDIAGLDGGALNPDEVNYVRRILRRGSSVAPPTAAQVDDALSALPGSDATLREIRAIFEQYGPYDTAGEVQIDGGSDALKYSAAAERAAIRNDLRVLLGFDPEAYGNVATGGAGVAVARDRSCRSPRPCGPRVW